VSAPKTDTVTTKSAGTVAEAERPDNVVALTSKAVKNLTDEQVAEFVAAHEDSESEPLTATLVATRETKIRQIEYNGTTPEGYVIRVWAPEGTSLLIGATLATA
jgi:hypothetical protein